MSLVSADNASVTIQLSTSSLMQYANKNRLDGFFNDIIIRSENENIPANRLVLSSSSKYFETMFKSKLLEQYQNPIEISGVGGTTLKAIIEFIYSGKLIIDSGNVMDLLEGADYLQLDEVKKFCFTFLKNNVLITPENCLSLLDIASTFSNSLLMKTANNYLSENFELISQDNKFKNLSKPCFTSCILNLNRSLIRESNLCKAILNWIKHDVEARKNLLSHLLQLVDFSGLSNECMSGLLNETIIKADLECSNMLNLKLLAVIEAIRNQNVANTQGDTDLQNSMPRMYCLGGENHSSRVTEVFNLCSSPKKDLAHLPAPLRAHRTIKLNNCLYCLGGCTGNAFNNTVFRLNITQKNSDWKKVAAMKEKRRLLAAALYNDMIVVCGGSRDYCKGDFLASSEVYSPEQNKWRMISSLNKGRHGHELIACNGSLYALGGYSSSDFLSCVEMLQGLDGNWVQAAPMRTPREWFSAVRFNCSIYAIGGANMKNVLKSVEKYDCGTNTWEYVSSMKIARSRHRACVLKNRIFVVGGRDEKGRDVLKIECYDPLLDSWMIIGDISRAAVGHSLVAF